MRLRTMFDSAIQMLLSRLLQVARACVQSGLERATVAPRTLNKRIVGSPILRRASSVARYLPPVKLTGCAASTFDPTLSSFTAGNHDIHFYQIQVFLVQLSPFDFQCVVRDMTEVRAKFLTLCRGVGVVPCYLSIPYNDLRLR